LIKGSLVNYKKDYGLVYTGEGGRVRGGKEQSESPLEVSVRDALESEGEFLNGCFEEDPRILKRRKATKGEKQNRDGTEEAMRRKTDHHCDVGDLDHQHVEVENQGGRAKRTRGAPKRKGR